jgi:general secretion pathway protein E
MIGEIRDLETAEIAVQASLTGHMVFSTLHTNTAPAAITRLIDMGVEKFLVSSSILAVLAQRLVRQLCQECKEKDKLSNQALYKAVGCSSCNYSGYSGRKAIAELFIMDDSVKSALKEDIDDTILFELAIKSGMISIKEQLKLMCENGDTSLEEAIRIGLN